MIEITITTKAGKFVMKGEEMVERFKRYLAQFPAPATHPEAVPLHLADFLSTYEEEVKTEESTTSDEINEIAGFA